MKENVRVTRRQLLSIFLCIIVYLLPLYTVVFAMGLEKHPLRYI